MSTLSKTGSPLAPAHADTGHTLMAWLAGMQGSLSKSVIAYFAKRKAIRELSVLDDRMLLDIGVARSDIGRIVDFGRRPPLYFG